MSKEDIIKHWEEKDGEHKYLEEVHGEEAINWVKQRNDHCLKLLGNPKDSGSTSNGLYNDILAILDSKDKIPQVTKYGEYYYNFWQDEMHPRGLYRRTSLESFVSANPSWETVLDIDELGKIEGSNRICVKLLHILFPIRHNVIIRRILGV